MGSILWDCKQSKQDFRCVLEIGSRFKKRRRIGLIDLIARGYGTLTLGFIAVYVIPVLTLGVWRIRATPAGFEPES